MSSKAQIIEVDNLSPESFKFLVEELHTFGKIEVRGMAKTLACVISCIGFDKFPMKDVIFTDVDTSEPYDVKDAEEDAKKMIITKKPDAIWIHSVWDHPVRFIRYEGIRDVELIRMTNGELRTLAPLKKSIRLTQPSQSGFIQPVDHNSNLMAPKAYQTMTVDDSKVQIAACKNASFDSDEGNVWIGEDGSVMEEVD